MFRKALSTIVPLCLAFALAGCGSSVKLSDVPVEDRAASANNPANASEGSGASASASAAAARVVAPVELAAGDAASAPPAALTRIIYFDYDSFTIKPDFQSVLEGHARFLNANKSRRVNIEGHTDERGGREYNLALGQKRAEAVRRALALLGVSETQMEAVSFGKEKPAAAGGSEEAFAKNRRAEITYR